MAKHNTWSKKNSSPNTKRTPVRKNNNRSDQTKSKEEDGKKVVKSRIEGASGANSDQRRSRRGSNSRRTRAKAKIREEETGNGGTRDNEGGIGG
ncbi:hypothetical protein PtB15_11B384 [Puccinia triticina]|nr:hypothetical protein PtB15_11B384 [Puccinia triticina]